MSHRLSRVANHVAVRDHHHVNYPLNIDEHHDTRNNMDVFNMSNGLQLTQITAGLPDTGSDEEQPQREWGGSQPGKAPNLNRDCHLPGDVLYSQYFSANPTYDHSTFQRRFRVTRNIFHRLLEALMSADSYFVQKRDCTCLPGISPFQKLTAVMRMMASSIAGDWVDDKISMSATTAMECMGRFCDVVIAKGESEYLRNATTEDVRRILSNSEKRGFPGMLGSIDCSKWKWRNCPTGFRGQYRGKEKNPRSPWKR